MSSNESGTKLDISQRYISRRSQLYNFSICPFFTLQLNVRFGSFADLQSARPKVRFSDLPLIFVPHVKLEFLPWVGRSPMPDLGGHSKNIKNIHTGPSLRLNGSQNASGGPPPTHLLFKTRIDYPKPDHLNVYVGTANLVVTYW